MDKEVEEDYSGNHCHPSRFVPLDFARQTQEGGGSKTSIEMVDYMLSSHPPPPQHQISLDKLSFADVMQFADFGPKLALNQSKSATPSEEESFFFKFQDGTSSSSMAPLQLQVLVDGAGREEEGGQFSENISSVQQQQQQQQQQQMGFDCGGGGDGQIKVEAVKNRRKRARSMKTSEEVESQRMTHIAVERNRRRQMNEHLRVLRSLMPGSYVQRGDQASIIGGAIEFLRELEQLLQCLESQKRRRLFGGGELPRNSADALQMLPIQQLAQQPFLPPLPLPGGNDNIRILELDPSGGGLQEDMAENKTCLADIEVRVLGYDAMIKILSRRRPGQLIKTIAALEDLQFNILHTNITTIEQTVLYSFNVKIMGETSCTAEDIANSVQQILSFINTSTI